MYSEVTELKAQLKYANKRIEQLEDTSYNGYANWETWNMALWLDNEEYLQEESRRVARHGRDALKDWCWDIWNVDDLKGFPKDVVMGAFSEVDWQELVDNFWEDEDFESEEESTFEEEYENEQFAQDGNFDNRTNVGGD